MRTPLKNHRCPYSSQAPLSGRTRQMTALALSLLGASFAANASEETSPFMVRIPVAEAQHPVTTTTFDFGQVAQGSVPQRLFTFTNRSSAPAQLGAVTTTGRAMLLSHNCTGTLAPWASCQLTLGVNAAVLGVNTGQVTVQHSAAASADVFALSATGVAISSLLSFDSVTVNFGSHTIRSAPATRTITLRNRGEEAAFIDDIVFARSTSVFRIDNHNCGVLEPGGSCAVSLSFSPASLGSFSAALQIQLEDGTRIPGATLNGTGVQGLAVWSAGEELRFEGVVVNEEATRKAVLTNAGQGELFLTDMAISAATPGGVSGFSVKASSCGPRLLPGQGCEVTVAFRSSTTSPQSGYLELRTGGSLSTLSRLKLFAQPQIEQSILSASPMLVDFGSAAVGASVDRTLTVSSVGQRSVAVTGYQLQGADAARFQILNASNCIGTLNVGQQCVLQLRASPGAATLHNAQLVAQSNTDVPLAPVALRVQGISGLLDVTPAVVNFPVTDVGATAQSSVTLHNRGQVPVAVGTLTRSGSGAFTLQGTSCAGQTLAPDASCVQSVHFAPTAPGAVTGQLLVTSNASIPQQSVALNGTGAALPVPVPQLSAFTCPSPGLAPTVVCTATLSNAGTTAFAVTAPGSTGNVRSTPQLLSCTSPLATFAPGATCTVQLTTTGFSASGPSSLSLTYLITAGGRNVTRELTISADVPRVTSTTVPYGRVTVGQSTTMVHTVTNTGALDVSLPVARATLSGTNAGDFSVTSTTCGATLSVGQSCTVSVRFAPSAAGVRTASLVVSPVNGPVVSTALSATGEAAVQPHSVTGPTSLLVGTYPTPMPATAIHRLHGNELSWEDYYRSAAGSLHHSGVSTFEFPLTHRNFSLTNGTPTRPVTVDRVEVVGPDASVFTVTTPPDSLLRAGQQNCLPGAVLDSARPFCLLVAWALPRRVGEHTAEVRVFFRNEANPAVTVLRATGLRTSLVPVNAPLHVANAAVGVPRSATGTLRNDGEVAVAHSGPSNVTTLTRDTAAIDAGFTLVTATAAHGNGSVYPGHSYTALAQLAARSAGTVTGSATMTYFGMLGHMVTEPLTLTLPLSGSVAAAAPVPLITVAVTDHGSTPVGVAKSVSHTFTNIGTAPWSLNVSSSSSTNSAFALTASACGSSLAPGASCTMTTRCLPAAVGALAGNITINGSNLASPLSFGVTCEGTPAPGQASLMALSPASIDFGSVLVGDTRTGTFTLTNNNPTANAPVRISAVEFLPASADLATSLQVTSHNCTTLASGQSCTINVQGRPAALAWYLNNVRVVSDATGTAPSRQVSIRGVAPSFVVSTQTLNFGQLNEGYAQTAAVAITVTNAGGAPGVITTAGMPNLSSHLALGGTCVNGATLAAGASCTRTVAIAPGAPVGALERALSFVFSNGQTATTNVTASVAPAPTPAGTLTVTCPQQASIGAVTGCWVRLSSTGAAPLPNTNVALTAFHSSAPGVNLLSGVTLSCSGRMPNGTLSPGGFCHYGFTVNASQLGVHTVNAAPVNSPSVSSSSSSFTAVGPHLELLPGVTPRVQVGSTHTTTHLLRNTGTGPATLGFVSSSHASVAAQGGTCFISGWPTTLESGQSCSFTTTCTPSTVDGVTATVVLGHPTVASQRISAAIACQGQPPSISAQYLSPVLSRTGGFTASGGWVRLNNTGSAPVTLGAITAATGRTLSAGGATNACAAGQSLAAGASCLLLDTINGQAPGQLVEGTHRVRINNLVDFTWAANPVTTQGLSVRALQQWPAEVQVSAVLRNTLRVTNEAPQALALPLTFGLPTGTTVVSNSCPAALGAGASCDVVVDWTAPAAVMSSANFLAAFSSAYHPLLAGNVVTSGAVTARPLGEWAHSVRTVAANVTLTLNSLNAPLEPGQTANLVATLSNSGLGPVSISSAPVLSWGADYSISATTCNAGAVLQPGASCTVTVRFAPTTFTPSTVTLTVPTSVGSRTLGLTGALVPATDVRVQLSSPTSVLAGSAATHSVTLTNSGTTPAQVRLNVGLANASGSAAQFTGLRAGVCGTWVISGGSATQTAPGTAVSGVTCQPSGNPLSPVFTLSAHATLTLTYDVAAGGSSGTYNISTSGTLLSPGMVDSAPSNNSASSATAVTFPPVDIAITGSGLSHALPTGGAGSLVFWLENRSTSTTLPVVTVAPALSGVAGLSLGAPVCDSPVAGAACPGTLPAMGRLRYTVPYTVTGAVGTQLRVTASISQTSNTTSDLVPSNNSVTLTANARVMLYAKQCYFASDRTTQAAPAIGTGYYANHISTDKWLRQHVADVTLANSAGSLTVGPYRMYNERTGLQDGPAVSYAIKGTNIGMMPGTGVINFRTNGGWGAAPAGFGTPTACLYSGSDISLVNRFCNGVGVAAGYFIWRDVGSSSSEVWFGVSTTRGEARSRARGSELVNRGLSAAELNDMYYVMWGEFSPSPTCQAPGSSTYRSHGL